MERQTRPSTEHENGPLGSASVAPSNAWARGVRRVCRVVLKRSIGLVIVGDQRVTFNWDTWQRSSGAGWGASDAGRVRWVGDRRVCCPRKRLVKRQRLYSFMGVINRWLVGLGRLAEYPWALVARVSVLGSPLTYSCLIVFIGSSERAILVRCIVRIASSDTRCSSCNPMVLVTLGGCHLLYGLVACDSVDARKKIVRGSGEVLWGALCSSRGSHEEQL
jgi:hypothetical protein